MIDKEQIRDLMRNCSEGQYERLMRHSIGDISFSQVDGYRIAYRYNEYDIITEIIFLLEEEKNCIFNTTEFIYCWCTKELGKYYLNKYSFLYETLNESHYYLGVRHEVRNQKGNLVLYWYE